MTSSVSVTETPHNCAGAGDQGNITSQRLSFTCSPNVTTVPQAG